MNEKILIGEHSPVLLAIYVLNCMCDYYYTQLVATFSGQPG